MLVLVHMYCINLWLPFVSQHKKTYQMLFHLNKRNEHYILQIASVVMILANRFNGSPKALEKFSTVFAKNLEPIAMFWSAKTRTSYYQNIPPPPPLNVVDSKNELPVKCFCLSLGGCKYLTTLTRGKGGLYIFKAPWDNQKSLLLLDRSKSFWQRL